jgi:hypothetical protein
LYKPGMSAAELAPVARSYIEAWRAAQARQ